MNADQALRTLLSDLGDDRAAVVELVNLFLTEGPTLLASGRAALKAKDIASLQRAYHTLKGNAAQFGLEGVREQALAIEQAARGGAFPKLDQLAALDQSWAEASAALAAWAANGR